MDSGAGGSLASWLSGVVALFGDTLAALYAVPIFQLFLGMLIFLVVLGLLRLLIVSGRRL